METTLPETILEFLTMAGLAVLIAAAGYLIAELIVRMLKKLLPRFVSDTWVDFIAGWFV